MPTPADASTPDTDAQRHQWDRVAAGWKKWWDTIEQASHRVSVRMLELACVSPGQRVLDIATGLGEPALLAARRVAPGGQVVGTDLSPQMLAIARERAATSGLNNVDFIEADAAQLNRPAASFDAVLCRWGITSLPNPFDTMLAVRRLLAPHGAFVTAVWEAGPTGRPLASIATGLAHEMFGEPTSRVDTPAAPKSVQQGLADDLRRAGFSDVRTESMTVTMTWNSADDCVQYLLDVSLDLADVLSGQSSAQHADYRQRLAARLQQYVAADGSVCIPNITICGVARS
ncbi:MAG: class I SAM-dependent methyltransferase [Gemmatimonadota bacterium]